jgi:serine/threonine-protein kinase
MRRRTAGVLPAETTRFRRGIDTSRFYGNVYHNLAWFLLYRHEPRQPIPALRFATAALAARPQSIVACVVMADACAMTGNWPEAETLWKDLIERQPQPWFYERLGDTWMGQGRFDDGVAEYRKAFELDANQVGLRKKLISLLAPRGRLEEVRASWAKALEQNPPDHSAWYGYAELCLFLGREDEYRRHRRVLLKRFGPTTEPQIAERAGRACLLLPATGDELRQAVALADRAFAAGPWHALYPCFQSVEGLAEFRQGRPEKAIPQLQQAAARIGQLAPRLVLAMALHDSGHAEQARKALADAVRDFDWNKAQAQDVDGWLSHVLRREAEALLK